MKTYEGTIRASALTLLAGGLMAFGIGATARQLQASAPALVLSCGGQGCTQQSDCGPQCYCNTPSQTCRSNNS